MDRQIDPRLEGFGQYLEEKIAEQLRRPYSEREDIERTLGLYNQAKQIYQQLTERMDLSEKYALKIEEQELSVRARACLRRAGINTVEDLVKLTEKDLSEIRNFGQTPLDEIKRRLADLGLSLRT